MQQDWTAAEVIGATGGAPVVLVCEHASHHVPVELDLGLSADARVSHAAWDIGALDIARALSDLMAAPLVAAGVSRLVYDLNRPLASASAIPEQSEIFEIPGNKGLSEAVRRDRFDKLHVPFHACVAETIAAQRARVDGPVAVVTIHTFTRVYNGQRRGVDIGYLCDGDQRIAQAALAQEARLARYTTALNEPYGVADGVTHTLRMHGDDNGLPSVMVEVCNDLVDTPETARDMADHLAGVLRGALRDVLGRSEAAE